MYREIVYIGSTCNFKQRITAHKSSKQETDKNFTNTIILSYCKSPSEARNIEEICIKLFSPLNNSPRGFKHQSGNLMYCYSLSDEIEGVIKQLVKYLSQLGFSNDHDRYPWIDKGRGRRNY